MKIIKKMNELMPHLRIFSCSCLIIMLVFNIRLYGQKHQNVSWLRNDSFKYEFVYQGSELIKLSFSPDSTIIRPLRYLVYVVLDAAQEEQIKHLTYKDWLSLLQDSNADFATNLLLYSIFERNAILLLDKERHTWMQVGKDDDIVYWKNFLLENIDKIQSIR